jgi:hypothetical protein
MHSQQRISIPNYLRAIAIVRRLEHYHAQLLLKPTATADQAKRLGYIALSKPFRPKYLDQCREMLALKRELERDFDILVVLDRKKRGLCLWKRSRLLMAAQVKRRRKAASSRH